jgi:hypothetical protein
MIEQEQAKRQALNLAELNKVLFDALLERGFTRSEAMLILAQYSPSVGWE